MKNFVKVIKQVEFTLDKIVMFGVFLNTLLVFLVLIIILMLFNINALYALIGAFIYLAIESYFKLIKTNKEIVVEKKYDILNEKLRTAADNVKLENPVVEELQKEVIGDLKNVKTSSFLEEQKSSYKIALSIILCFVIVGLAMTNARIIGLNLYVNNVPVFNRTIRIVGNKVILAELNQSEDIYGDEELAKLGDIELGIKVKPADYKVDIREEGDVEEKIFDETFPTEVFVESATVYEENIPVDQQELVKNYFKKIAVS